MRVINPRMFAATLLLAGLFCVINSSNVSAHSFDPGHIISDSIFTNSNTMTADQVQKFIEVKGAYCTDGSAPCLKNYRENGKSAGTIIAEVAQAYAINPQVLLVVLQKEVGLLTLDKPAPWRYRTAMGYGCPDSTPGVCDSRYFGFTNQVRWAATMFRAIMNYSPTWYTPYHIGVNKILYHPNAACGASNVTIVNRATVALYSYTPYQPNQAALAAGFGIGDECSAYGNRNFWLYFNTWFGSSTSSILIQSPQSPAVYLQSGNTRYAIPSWDIINAYGFGRFGVTPVSDAYANSLQDGGILSTVFSNTAEPGPIYLADNGYRFGFSSYQQCIDWGFPKCNDSAYTKALEPSVFDRMYQYGDLSPLMLNGSHVHIMRNGKKHTLLTHQARIEAGYGATPPTPMTNPENTRQPYAESIPHNNTIVSFRNTPAIYFYTNNRFYGLSYDAFLTLSSSFPILIDTFSSYTQLPPPTHKLIGPLVGLSDGSVYSFVDGKKINLTAVRQHWPQAPLFDELQMFLKNHPDAHTATQTSTYRTQSGAIADIKQGRYHGFYSLRDYFALGHNHPIPISDAIPPMLAPGEPVLAQGHGSVYQLIPPANQSLILTTSTDGTACQLSSLDQLGSYRLVTNTVYRLPAPPQQSVRMLTPTVYDQAGNLHIVHTGSHAIIPKAELAAVWGIRQPFSACSLHSTHLSTIPITTSAVRFIRDARSGVIYYGEGGKRRPIYSYSAFIRMGGSAGNTLDISDEFIHQSPEGMPITK